MNATANGRAAILGNGRHKPAALQIDAASIPAELRDLDRWVGWRWRWRANANGGRGKWDKPPINVSTGADASSTDEATWSDFGTAYAAAEAGEVDGIGIVLGDLGDGRTLTGVDCDDCRDPFTSEISSDASLALAMLDSYAEVSPTRTGVKVLCYGTLPQGRRSKGGFECYQSGRYFTVTGERLPQSKSTVRHATEALAKFHATFIEPTAAPETSSDRDDGSRPDVAAALDALAALKPQRADDYADWLMVGMALKSLDEHLLGEWDRWSLKSAKYAPGECAAKWKTFSGSGVGIGSLLFLAKQDGWQPKPADKPREKIRYAALSCAELAAGDFSVEFLINNALVAGQPLIIAGAMKTLKTSFIIDAAVSLATGGHFLGALPVDRACRVGVMTGESGLATIQETAVRVCSAAGRWLDQLDGLFWSEDLPKFGDPAHLEAVEAFLLDYELEALFIDPAYLCLPGADAGNLMMQGELLRGMADVCRRNGALLALCHHTKRNIGRDPYDVPELADIAWSGFSEFARQWWLIGRREKYQPGTGSHKLWLSIGGSAGHGGLWGVDVEEGLRTDPGGRQWEVALRSATEVRDETESQRDDAKAAKAAMKLQADRENVCRVLARHPDGLTASRIRDLASLGNRYLAVIDSMAESGELAPCKVRVSNHKSLTDGYRLGGNENA